MENKMQQELNDQLLAAASIYKGQMGPVLSLLELGAEVDCRSNNGKTPLIMATIWENLGVVSVLLGAGADTSLRDEEGKAAADYARHRPDILDILKFPPPKKVVEIPDEVIFQRPLGDRTLQESFNFVTRERISLIRNGKHGPVEAMVRENFSVIEDEATLRKAFEEHVRRGGKTEEAVVFPNKLLKNKLPR
jgi:hypothetical protein